MNTLLCTISHNGNAIAILEGQPNERFLVAKSGEFKHDASLQFPDYLLHDKVSGEESPEVLLRGYFHEKMAAKIAAEKAEAEAEEKAAAMVKTRCGSFQNAVAIIHSYNSRRDYVEPTAKALKAALKKVELKNAREKEAAEWAKLCDKTCAALRTKAPKAPIKGVGFDRVDWPSNGHNKKMEALLAAIPSAHKDKIASRRQKGYFSWSVVVSPEAMKKVSKLIDLASK